MNISNSTSIAWASQTQTDKSHTNNQNFKGVDAGAIDPLNADVITISKNAKVAFDQWVAEQDTVTDPEKFWKKYFSYEWEPKTPGISRSVKLEGNAIEVLEYQDGQLVKQITGSIVGNTVITDTDIYNSSGDVTQSIHSVLQGVNDDSAILTQGKLTRNLVWFGKDGNIVREMNDSMELQSHYQAYDDANIPSDLTLEGLSGMPTFDNHTTKYEANILQYESGMLRKRISLYQKGDYANLTNRTEKGQEGIGASATNEMAHATEMALYVTDYDEDGNILQQATLKDEQYNSAKGDGKLKQQFSMVRYKEGEIVEKQYGHLSLDKVKGGSFSKRPSLLETIGISQEEYASTTPQAASGLLARGLIGSSTEARHYGSSFYNSGQADAYNSARRIAEYGAGGSTYDTKWTTESYVNGKLAAKKVDEESATRNPMATESTFRTGGGLTEDARPATLHRSKHVEESYENGELKVHAELRFSEHIKKNQSGKDVIQTTASGTKSAGMTRQQIHETYAGSLLETDRDAHVATYGLGRYMDMSLIDMHGLYSMLDQRI